MHTIGWYREQKRKGHAEAVLLAHALCERLLAENTRLRAENERLEAELTHRFAVAKASH